MGCTPIFHRESSSPSAKLAINWGTPPLMGKPRPAVEASQEGWVFSPLYKGSLCPFTVTSFLVSVKVPIYIYIYINTYIYIYIYAALLNSCFFSSPSSFRSCPLFVALLLLLLSCRSRLVLLCSLVTWPWKWSLGITAVALLSGNNGEPLAQKKFLISSITTR